MYHSRAYLFLRLARCYTRRRRTSCVIQTQLAASQQRWCCVHSKYALSCARPVVISPCQLHRRKDSITGSNRNPSFLGKIKVMTAECINLRTVPAARCISRIGNGGVDGIVGRQVGGLMSGLALGGRPWMITNISSSSGGGGGGRLIIITIIVIRSGLRINTRERY